MKIFLLSIVLSSACRIQAQPANGEKIKIRNNRPARIIEYKLATSKFETIIFPSVILKDTDEDARRIEQKINSFLQADLLSGIAPASKLLDLIRMNSRLADESDVGLTGLSYEVVRNDGRILSLLIHRDFIGAYPWWLVNTCSFDLTTGDVLTWHSLFTSTGYNDVNTKILHVRDRIVKNKLRSLHKDMVEGNSQLDESTFEVIKEYFDGCRENIDPNHLQITKATIAPDDQECLQHYLRFYDLSWITEIPIRSIKNDLNGYGKWLLRLSDTLTASSTEPISYFLTGKIGTYPITAELLPGEEDSTIHGYYYYNSRKEFIPIHGHILTDRSIEFEEQIEDSGPKDPRPTWRGELKNNSFTGTWTDASGKRSLPIELQYR